MQIVLLCHAETEIDQQKYLLGWVDKSLSDSGKLATSQLAAFMKQQEEQCDLILASPLTRARQTAVIIAQDWGSNLLENELIKERNFGQLAGKEFSEIFAKNPEAFLNERFNVLAEISEAESLTDLEKRINHFLHFLMQLRNGNKYQRVLVVTHESIIRIMLRLLEGYSANEEFDVPINSLSKFEIEL